MCEFRNKQAKDVVTQNTKQTNKQTKKASFTDRILIKETKRIDSFIAVLLFYWESDSEEWARKHSRGICDRIVNGSILKQIHAGRNIVLFLLHWLLQHTGNFQPFGT